MNSRKKIEKILVKNNELPGTYYKTYRENVFQDIPDKDFYNEIASGKGSELKSKFMSIASSTALVINTFAPFKSAIPMKLLLIDETNDFSEISFEKGINNGLRGTNPQLDIYLKGKNKNVAIESKFLEIAANKGAASKTKLSDQYRNIQDSRRTEPWYKRMLKLDDDPGEYQQLDVIQLLKHLFGICHTEHKAITELLYLYWRPSNFNEFPELKQHENEIIRFSKELIRMKVNFRVLTYQELWSSWEDVKNRELSLHVSRLRKKYDIK